MMNKLLLAIDHDTESIERFIADTPGFLDEWEAASGHLTSEERSAFQAWDYAALYAMGAHPFLLFQAMRAAWVPTRIEMPDFIEAYRAAVTPLGRPDFTT